MNNRQLPKAAPESRKLIKVSKDFIKLLGNAIHDPDPVNYAALGKHVADNADFFLRVLTSGNMTVGTGLQLGKHIKKHIRRED